MENDAEKHRKLANGLEYFCEIGRIFSLVFISMELEVPDVRGKDYMPLIYVKPCYISASSEFLADYKEFLEKTFLSTTSFACWRRKWFQDRLEWMGDWLQTILDSSQGP